MSEAVVLLDAVTVDTTGAGIPVPVVGRDVAFMAHLGGPGGFGSVVLQGSLDGAIWFNLDGLGDPAYFVHSGPVAYVRAVYTAEGSTGPVTVQALQSDVN